MLKIIADDLGLHKSVNDGIIFLVKNNKIDGASLMTSGEAFDDAIAQCLGAEPLNIGIHLVLVEEKSLSGIKLPKSHRLFFIKYILGLIKLSAIEKELRAQLDKCIQSGIKPTFINSHQHLHLLPGIMNIVISVAQEYRIPYIRIVNEIVFIPRSYYKYNSSLIKFILKFLRIGQLLVLKLLSGLAKKKIKNSGLKCNDFFIGFVNAGDLSDEDINRAKKLANQYPNSVIELGCHPGHESRELREKYKWGRAYNWKKELDLLEFIDITL
ncbi:MAG: hypothetical protein A2817_02750 [Candidatus Yanofskybacteria bacterium RIFCSPHIGHO2_01_FULL_39_8b]|uniref:ChbG/HpnK family deacetylase n=1 Tax=Candidatus Yanofskybacteria bacterium RIFCSPHIGHO2_01_FULL_39_8b TaxID=1802659 RepID=A0A1F8EGY6_9BACT|nr:MAG: hypothetical protein A2817_02750 [Candidatus Yanofskybacteria bacterium RIFCSPHIGHO2_01_FULL_39_8b]